MTETFYASWYGEESIDKYGFNANLSTSEHNNLDDAKIAAFKNASRADVQGWCGVHSRIVDRFGEHSGIDIFNECYRGTWSGWRACA